MFAPQKLWTTNWLSAFAAIFSIAIIGEYAVFELPHIKDHTDATLMSKAQAMGGDAPVADLPAGFALLPLPSIPPPIVGKRTGLVKATLEAKIVNGLMADGVGFSCWTYNGTVSGPVDTTAARRGCGADAQEF